MSSAVLTKQQIQKEMEAESSARLVYNPSNRWLDGRVASQPYPLCPDGTAIDIRTGEEKTTDGVSEIKDFWDNAWDSKDGGKRTPTGGRELHVASLDAVLHLTESFPFIARLTGDEKRDENIKAAARKRWIKHRVDWAKEVIGGREAMLREFHAAPSNAGRVPDPPNALEMEAYEFMAEYRTGELNTSKYACKHDGVRTDDPAVWEKHMRAFHPGDLEKEVVVKGKKKD